MPEQPPTLRDMLKAARDRGQTYEQLEAFAIDPETGERASRSLLNNIVLDKVDRMPYDYHLRAIAAALKVPYETVRRAAITQWIPSGSIDGAGDRADRRRTPAARPGRQGAGRPRRQRGRAGERLT
jgi:hypothetical protein